MSDGLLLIDKEPGCTSHDVVQEVRKRLGRKKVGHCGTLDPAATGLLVLTVGRATRLTRFLINAPKVYEGVLRFGVVTDTYDAEGQVLEERPLAGLDREWIELEMSRLVGTFEQAAPPFSAKKLAGRKYYELARRGEEVPEARKEITVFEFSPQGELAEDRLEFRLSCTSGTYVRSLAHDLGATLGCGAHLASLTRTRVGPFRLEDAIPLQELPQDGADEVKAQPAWIPFDRIPLPFDEITTDARQERRITHGQTVLVREMSCEEGDWIKLINRRRQLIAVGTVIERIGSGRVGVVQPKIVFR